MICQTDTDNVNKAVGFNNGKMLASDGTGDSADVPLSW